MSSTIKQAIDVLKTRIADAYTAVATKGGILPVTQDSMNLPSAIESIPANGGTIEDVNALPDASQYKNKVVRLTTDNNLYQSVETSTSTTIVWDWKALTNDWAVGAIYRYYSQEVVGAGYDNYDWITAILNFTMKNYTRDCLQKLQDSGYGEGTFLIVHFKYWNGTEWIEDRVAVSATNALSVGGIMSAEEFNTYVNEILNVKTNEYDAHSYIYITNIGIYLDNVSWDTVTMGFDMNVFSDAIAFPIDTDLYPEYIELYPQKNE